MRQPRTEEDAKNQNEKTVGTAVDYNLNIDKNCFISVKMPDKLNSLTLK